MKLWVDAVKPAPNEQEYAWMRSLDMAMFAISLNERKGCPYEGIDVGHVIGTWENIGGVEFLEWLEKTRRNYPVRVHATDPVEKGPMEEIVQRNGWDIFGSAEVLYGASVEERLADANARAINDVSGASERDLEI